MIDVISPCVTFNDHQGSTKSYTYVKDHRHDLQTIDFVPFFQEIQLEDEYPAGSSREVTLHDGSHLMLRKLEEEYDPSNRMGAVLKLEQTASQGEVLTGVFYVDTKKPNFMEALDLHPTALAHMKENHLRPPQSVLEEIMEELR
jgi:2-oxoglutarate ferredoxin oxidoreductase subunit beta